MNDVRVSWSQSVGDGDAVAAVSAARGARGGTDASAETNQQSQDEEQRRRQRQHNESPLRNRNKSDKKAKDSAISSPSGQSIEDELIVLHKLGAGAGGVVHKAVHVPTMTMVAVKRIRLFDRSELRQMSKELKALYTCSAAVGGHSSRRRRGSSFARDTEISGAPSADGTMGDERRHVFMQAQQFMNYLFGNISAGLLEV